MCAPYEQYMYAYPHKTAYRPLNNIDIRPYLRHLGAQANHIYIHLPFCQSKCGFCNLFSVAGSKPAYIDDYLCTIERQLTQYATQSEVRNARFSSLIIGGGTPLVLSEGQLQRLFAMVEKHLPIRVKDVYTVIETSPTQSDNGKLQLIHNAGVNRISLGVQSFVADELTCLGRSHSVEQAREALKRIAATGFDEINIDLIYGIPNQTMDSLSYSVEQALTYTPHEIFIYPLYLKPGTSMFRKHTDYKDSRAEMYAAVRKQLLSAGYTQTSMRRFVRDGNEQATSCGFDNTLALGCGGRSYLSNLHFCEPFAVSPQHCKATIDSYIAQTDFLHATHGSLLSDDEQKRRYAIKHLFFHTGIDEQEYIQHFNSSAWNDFPFLKPLEDEGFIYRKNSCILLTESGLALSDGIGPMFISPDVRRLMAEYTLR